MSIPSRAVGRWADALSQKSGTELSERRTPESPSPTARVLLPPPTEWTAAGRSRAIGAPTNSSWHTELEPRGHSRHRAGIVGCLRVV